MICPVCGNTLRAVERSGIEIDICPGCKGVWLDRGELDKIVQRENAEEQQYSVASPGYAQEHHDERYRSHDDHHRDYRHDGHSMKQRKRGSWISDIFEGFGGD